MTWPCLGVSSSQGANAGASYEVQVPWSRCMPGCFCKVVRCGLAPRLDALLKCVLEQRPGPLVDMRYLTAEKSRLAPKQVKYIHIWRSCAIQLLRLLRKGRAPRMMMTAMWKTIIAASRLPSRLGLTSQCRAIMSCACCRRAIFILSGNNSVQQGAMYHSGCFGKSGCLNLGTN